MPYVRQRNPRPGPACRRSWSSWPRSAASCAPRCSATRCARPSPSDDRRPRDVPAPETLLDEAAIAGHASRAWPAEIAADHPDGVVLVGVLKGASIFLADLARAHPRRRRGGRLHRHLALRARLRAGAHPPRRRPRPRPAATSCWSRTSSTPASPSATWSSTSRAQGPRRVDVCTLLDRPARRILPRRRCATSASRSPTCSCSATGCTAPTCTATSRGSWSPTASWCGHDPDAYVAALYGGLTGGRTAAGKAAGGPVLR